MIPLCIAHRGKHKEYFENTIGAFKEAAKGKYYGVETDIHLTKDKKWIIHHDPDFLSNGKKITIVNELATDLVKMPLDNEFGIKDAYCPMFEDYLRVLKDSGKRPIIEIKPKNPSLRQLLSMLNIVKKYFSLNEITIIAFYPWPLIKLRIFKRKIHLQQLIGDQHTSFVYKLARFFRMDIDIDENVLTDQMINEVHQRKRKVNVWTVDKKENLRRWSSKGVDYITTNEFNQED